MSQQNIFSIIKANIPIIEVIGDYTTLKKAGHYWKGRCPFHQEKTASFTVSPHIDIFYCFGCHETGDVIGFVSKIEHCSQLEAAHHLAEKYQIDIPTESGAGTESKQQKRHSYDKICAAFSAWTQKELTRNQAVLSYLVGRKFTTESLSHFEVGYFPGGLQNIKQLMIEMQKQHILPSDLIGAHIIAEGKQVMYSPFEDRIMFPIKDHLGNYCGFGGRTYKPADQRPKYYNSRESDFFSKGTLLFGLDKAKKNIQETDTVYLVEGYTDCIAMAQMGYQNTVATLGTACTPTHLKLLSRYANRVVVVYDNDTAGNQATLRLTQMCWQANMEPFMVHLPDQQDPASLLAQDIAIKPYIEGAEDIFIFFITSLSHDFFSMGLNQKLQLITSILQTIMLIEDEMKRDILLQKMSSQLDIHLDILKKELAKIEKAKSADQQEKPTPQSPEPCKAPEVADDSNKLEKVIFCTLFRNIQLLNKKPIFLIISYLPSTLRTLLLKLKEHYDTHHRIDFHHFFESLDEEERRYVTSLLIENESIVDEAAFETLIERLKKKWWKTISHTIKQQIVQAKKSGDEKKIAELLQDFVQLQKKIVGPQFDAEERTEHLL